MRYWCNVSEDYSRQPFDEILNKCIQTAAAQQPEKDHQGTYS